jgi:hypothetical protein
LCTSILECSRLVISFGLFVSIVAKGSAGVSVSALKEVEGCSFSSIKKAPQKIEQSQIIDPAPSDQEVRQYIIGQEGINDGQYRK